MIELTTKSGALVPPVGLGTVRLNPDAVRTAVEIGYKLIDTSDDYGNEAMIGNQLQRLYDANKVKRENMFLQTKVSDDQTFWDEPLLGVNFWANSPFMQRHSVEEVMREKIRTSKRRLHTDYLDSVLLHFPYPDYFVEMWDVLCRIKDEENIRYIGVSNFSERHFVKLSKNSMVPQINQTYFSPIGTRQSVCDYCNDHNILLMTYSPLMDFHAHRINSPVLNELADKYGKDPAQIILRWNIERGSIPCPKSNHKERLASNLEAANFELSQDDVNRISSMNYNFQFIPESRYCPGI